MSIIKIENLSKRYIIGHDKSATGMYKYKSLRDTLVHTARGVVQRIRHPFSPNTENTDLEEFWALKDINLEIEQGDKVGIIGRNGAGKSTLLKILSRITEPTTGKIQINGRVASLLEVGTGFHPELTGRENIYLNGSILGMKRAEIKKKFDEIVDFSGVEKFLDTPVKRYSSGMYVRLAFAVAAHLEPEILLIDEVLAVGDAEFQKKCLGKMDDISKQGRTILFVSHNMAALRQLCLKSIVIEQGVIVCDDDTDIAMSYYLNKHNKIKTYEVLEKTIKNLPYDPVFKLESIILNQCGKEVQHVIENGKAVEIIIRYRVLEDTLGFRVFFDLYDDQEILLFRSFNDEDSDGMQITRVGYYISRVVIPPNLLAPINYSLKIFATIFNVRTFYPEGITISLKAERTGKANRAYLTEPIRGKLAPVFFWKTERIS